MIGYAEALRRAKASKADWNEEERISKAILTWVDNDWEYETEIENEDMEDSEFTAWIEEHAEKLVKQDADTNNTVCEEFLKIDYRYDTIDDDERFSDDYDAYLEFEWECRTGR